jgi:hypothetical protein
MQGKTIDDFPYPGSLPHESKVKKKPDKCLTFRVAGSIQLSNFELIRDIATIADFLKESEKMLLNRRYIKLFTYLFTQQVR